MLTKGDVLVAIGQLKNPYGSAEKLNTDLMGPSGKRVSERAAAPADGKAEVRLADFAVVGNASDYASGDMAHRLVEVCRGGAQQQRGEACGFRGRVLDLNWGVAAVSKPIIDHDLQTACETIQLGRVIDRSSTFGGSWRTHPADPHTHLECKH
jgi:hypothetical protein